MSGRTVSGLVHLHADVPAGTVLRIQIEDVSRMDMPSETRAALDIPLPAGAPNGTEIPFRLTLEAADPNASYNVRAHADANASGEVTHGDLLTTRANPLPDTAGEAFLTLDAQPV
jgi:uncharacterized lipoprotein YbaY